MAAMPQQDSGNKFFYRHCSELKAMDPTPQRVLRANATFGRLDKIVKNNGCSLKTKIPLYNSIVVSTLLYESETWRR